MISLPAWLKRWIEAVQDADSKKILQIILGICGVILLLTALYVWRYVSVVSSFKKKIVVINEQREEARVLREKMLQVQNQRTAVDGMLAEEPDFKIGGYVNLTLQKLKLTDKKRMEEATQVDREDNYRETEIAISMVDMNMRQLVELLHEIELKQRIYIKKLEIEKSKKQSGSLEVNLTIATLISKNE
jgi:hypothetical protein